MAWIQIRINVLWVMNWGQTEVFAKAICANTGQDIAYYFQLLGCQYHSGCYVFLLKMFNKSLNGIMFGCIYIVGLSILTIFAYSMGPTS